MHSYRKSLILTMLLGVFVACEESAVPTDGITGLELAAKPVSAVYTYIFSGDIQGVVENVPGTASDPFKQIATSGLTFSFPASSGDTGVCDAKQPELLESTNDWGGYADADWTGSIDLSRRKRSSFHLQITGSQTDGTGSINLAVNDVPEEDTNVIQFVNARALISALSYSETDGGQPTYDAADRCVNFTITAEPQ